MKRISDLTIEDLAESPVWRYEEGTGPRALVSATDRAELSRGDDEVYLAATDFELFDGSRYPGYCFPVDDSGIDYLQPALVGPSGHVNFWTEDPADPENLVERWQTIGKETGQVFPVAFRCRVPVDHRTISGWIAGVESSRDLTVAIRELPGDPGVDGVAGPATLEQPLTARPVESRQRGGTVEKRTGDPMIGGAGSPAAVASRAVPGCHVLQPP